MREHDAGGDVTSEPEAPQVDVSDPTRSGSSWSQANGGMRHWGPGQQTAQSGGALYALGSIGALIWFLSRAKGPKGYVVALMKTVVWPAFLVFNAFRALGGSSGEAD